VNDPTTFPGVTTEALYEATTLPDGESSDTLQVVPTALVASAVVVLMMITSPCFPDVGASAIVQVAACASGIVTGIVKLGIVIGVNGRSGISGIDT
jgi:hypothetical protein